MKRIFLYTLTCAAALEVAHAQTDVFTVFELPTGVTVHDMTVDEDNNIWLATDNGTLRFDRQTTDQLELTTGLSSLNVTSIARTHDGLQAGLDDGTLAHIDGSSATWSSKTFSTSTSFGHFTYIRQGDAEVYYGTNDGKVFIWPNGHPSPDYTDFLGQFTLDDVTGMGKTQSGIYAYTSLDGIVIESPAQSLMFKVDQSFGLSDNEVLSSMIVGSVGYHCTAQMVTVADYSAGLPPAISYLSTGNSDLPSNRVQASAFSDDGLWFGTDAGVALKQGSDWTVYTADNSNLPSDDVQHLAVDAEGEVWIVTADGHLSTTLMYETEAPQSTPDLASQYEFSVFPNPAIDRLNVKWSGGEEPTRLQIFNASGELIQEQTSVTSGTTEVDVSDLASGLYLVKLGGQQTKSVMIQR